MEADRPGRVIVGVDVTLSGLQAVRVAVAQARARGVPLHAVRTWSPPSSPAEPEPRSRMPAGPAGRAWSGQPGQPGQPEWGAVAETTVTQAFEETMGGRPADLEVHTVLVPDSPGPVLTEYACRADDLLVLGTGRRSRFRRRWRSRVVRYCVARASCPVLLVPPPPLAATGQRALLRELWRELDQLAERGPDW